MPRLVALLRAVNVGGTGTLAMAELRALCGRAGFTDVETYIQSGNAVFASALAERAVKEKLERALAAHLGAPVGVQVRSAAQLAAVLAANPFSRAPPNRVLVHFLDRPPPVAMLRAIAPPGGEELQALGREVFVHYPQGQGSSRLRLPFAAEATARNLNTVARLAAMAASASPPR